MKKQYVLIGLFYVSLFSLFSQQQTVKLNFSAKMQDNTWQALDSVCITNQSRSWSVTIHYPDTLLEMINSVGINEPVSNGFALMQNIPNPFKGSTDLSLLLPARERITLKMFDLNGRECASLSQELEAGLHYFHVSAGAAQMYVLQVTSSFGNKTLKMLALEAEASSCITYKCFTPQKVQAYRKASTDKKFISNDQMVYTGYSTYEGVVRRHSIHHMHAGNDTSLTFILPMGYSVGDVYYDSKGKPEGIVCWLADTVLSMAGIAYGNHGKIISMDEGVSLMYSTNNSGYPTRAYDSLDGRINTDIHMNIKQDTNYMFPERLEAVSWCTDKGEGWYFPARCELAAIYAMVVKLNTSLQNAGGTLFTVSLMQGPSYWSSTEKVQIGTEACQAYSIYFHNGLLGLNPVYEKLRVRAMKWF